jgi:alkyl hydroperoxide reductase subunit AhpC
MSAATAGDRCACLDALQTDELCPCNWQEGQEPLAPPLMA